MSGLKRWLVLASMLLAMMATGAERAEGQTTTTVQDTVYLADGTTAAGTVLVSWGAFTTATGASIAAGNTSATLGAGGLLTIALVPNANATPMGSYYTAVFHLSDGTTSHQYWVIPAVAAGGAPVKLAAIESQVLPTSVAMQTVSKAYVDNAIAAAETGFPTGASPYVQKSGDTMTGPLVLPGDPVSPTQAADKNYVDNNVASIASGLGQKVSTLPTGTQVVGQPAGTQLEVNHLNGELYASQYANGTGNNGINNALASSDCANGCKVEVDPSYTGNDAVYSQNIPSGGAVVDARGGTEAVTTVNPLGVGTSESAGGSLQQVETLSTPQLQALRPGTQGMGARTLSLSMDAVTGGSNQFPQDVETLPYGKSTYGVLSLTGNYNTQGQHVQFNNVVNCYSVGDCLAGGQFITTSGGYRDNSDEGTHPYDLQVSEDSRVFEGMCSGGCTAGSTQLTLTNTANSGTQGDGRFLIDLNPTKVLSTGYLTAGTKTILAYAAFGGVLMPVSVFLSTAQAATSQPNNLSPGTVTLAISTTALTPQFATSTAALPSPTGVACVADQGGAVFEMANYKVVDATHLQLTLNKVHAVGTVIAVGGLCGYGLEQKVDTINGIRQVFPIVGAWDPSDVYYADGGGTTVVGRQGDGSTGGYLNVSLTIATVARSGNVVTVTTASGLPEDVNGLTMTVSGVADSSYNGSFQVTTTSANTLTYNDAGTDSTSTGGTIADVTGSYAMYPMAEVLSVANPATKQVDGTFVLAPNNVAWAAGDPIEEPHFYQQYVTLDTEMDTQYVPRPIQYTQAGKDYLGNVGPGLRGWQVTNGVPASEYLGGGGTHATPDDGYVVSGPWSNDFEVDAGLQAVLAVHCNYTGCNRWDSGYDLFLLDTETGKDKLYYQPQSSTASWILAGTSYSFSPSAFTAGTINVGTLNATTINGGIAGGAISSGTINAARLPVFGASGTTHAAGAVPDPGATAGATRFLREDGTWDVPAGGSGGGGSASGSAGGDLSGSYPNPTVSAVHATSGTLSGVTGSFSGATGSALAESSSDAGGTILSLKNTSGGGSQYNIEVPGSGAPIFANNGLIYHDVTNGLYPFWYSSGSNAGIWAVSGALFGWGSSAVDPRVNGASGLDTAMFRMGPGEVGVTASPLTTPKPPANGTLAAGQYLGPATAPSGACSTSGAWVFSQDGHATFCSAGTWVTKI